MVPCGWVGGVFAASLGFLPCAVLFLRACSLRSFPSCRLPCGFPVTGCLSCFPGDVGWASALPFFFCVRVLQLRWGLLGLTVRSPCCPSLTLGWVCFWPAVSQAFVGCEVGLGCPSWFVNLFLCLLSFTFSGVGVAWSQVCGPSCDSWVLMLGCAVLTPWPLAAPSPFVTVDFFLGHLFGLGLVGHVCASVPTFFWWCSPSRVLGFAWRLWPLGGLGTCCFLGPYLGFFPLASNVGRWLEVVEVYPWWSSLRSFGVEVVTLVLCQALVGLPSGHCCASGLLGPVVFLTSC